MNMFDTKNHCKDCVCQLCKTMLGKPKKGGFRTSTRGNSSGKHTKELLKALKAIHYEILEAPAMLEALKAVVANWKQINDEHFSGPSKKLLNICRELIAKAEG